MCSVTFILLQSNAESFSLSFSPAVMGSSSSVARRKGGSQPCSSGPHPSIHLHSPPLSLPPSVLDIDARLLFSPSSLGVVKGAAGKAGRSVGSIGMSRARKGTADSGRPAGEQERRRKSRAEGGTYTAASLPAPACRDVVVFDIRPHVAIAMARGSCRFNAIDTVLGSVSQSFILPQSTAESFSIALSVVMGSSSSVARRKWGEPAVQQLSTPFHSSALPAPLPPSVLDIDARLLSSPSFLCCRFDRHVTSSQGNSRQRATGRPESRRVSGNQEPREGLAR
jgi:hypothetical protein